MRVKRHPLVTFFGLAYALSWLPSLFEAHSILPLGPLFAALIVVPIIGGWRPVLGVPRSDRPVACGVALVRAGPWAAAHPPADCGGAERSAGAPMPQLTQIPAWSNFVPWFASFSLLLIGLGEEPAWRGVALQRLQVGRSALAVILGLLHVLWHLPLFGLEYDRFNGLPWLIAVLASLS